MIKKTIFVTLISVSQTIGVYLPLKWKAVKGKLSQHLVFVTNKIKILGDIS